MSLDFPLKASEQLSDETDLCFKKPPLDSGWGTVAPSGRERGRDRGTPLRFWGQRINPQAFGDLRWTLRLPQIPCTQQEPLQKGVARKPG